MTAVPVVVYFDGLNEPINPGGYACWAWVALAQDGSEIAHDCGCLGSGEGTTNNIAEYHALLEALRWLAVEGHVGVLVRGDSQLIINQTAGGWACNKQHLRALRDDARVLVKATGARLQWVPREKNVRADGYSRDAYQDARKAAR